MRFECGVRSARPPASALRQERRRSAAVGTQGPDPCWALLLVNRGRPVSVDRIAEVLGARYRPLCSQPGTGLHTGRAPASRRPGDHDGAQIPGSTSARKLLMRSASRLWSAPVGMKRGWRRGTGRPLRNGPSSPGRGSRSATGGDAPFGRGGRLGPGDRRGRPSVALAELAALVEDLTRYVSGCVSYWLRPTCWPAS